MCRRSLLGSLLRQTMRCGIPLRDYAAGVTRVRGHCAAHHAAHHRVNSQSKQEKRTESAMEALAAGFVSQNSAFYPIPFKPVPKDAGAAPASFEPLYRCVRPKLEFCDTNPASKSLSDPAGPSQDPGYMRRSLPPSVCCRLPSH